MSDSGWKFGPLFIVFFLFFLFFFFLSTKLLASELSLDEEYETEKVLTSGEGEEYITGE
jgi:hypothetical protein